MFLKTASSSPVSEHGKHCYFENPQVGLLQRLFTQFVSSSSSALTAAVKRPSAGHGGAHL